MPSSLTLASVLLGLLLPVSAGLGQDQEGDALPTLPTGPDPYAVRYELSSNYLYQITSKFDAGGDVDVHRTGLRFSASRKLSEEASLSFNFGYELNAYDFDGVTSFAGADDPWDSVQFYNLRLQYSYAINHDLTVFAGPVFQIARETGADWDDSWIAGGYGGASLRVDDDLTVGAGIGVTSQIQESARFYPIIIVNWELAQDFQLVSSNSVMGSGLEVRWNLDRDSVLGVGGAFQFRRFRLDKDGIAPDGVGEETGVTIWARLNRQVNAGFEYSLWGGIVVGGEAELELGNGVVPGHDEYQLTAIVGLSAKFRF
ncbi:MAG: hypothetical protein HKO59_00605 [Phycisphaerales bacterium]|nr:hypothetical protein [Phycisphaerae bacterium]NNF42667.1 hypothetical protein [Phycisphaerales bacterium]NNM24480.1 hypothetical protein [Phycisphaerales bacterium]